MRSFPKQLGSRPAAILSCALALAASPWSAGAQDKVSIQNEEPVVFRHVLDNEPIVFDLMPDEEITPAVEQFHETAENPYDGDEEAIAEGRATYMKLCQACHLKDGTGRIGPSLVDEETNHPAEDHHKYMFEIIYAGGAGAMQAFGRRISQDEILRVMAFLETLHADH